MFATISPGTRQIMKQYRRERQEKAAKAKAAQKANADLRNKTITDTQGDYMFDDADFSYDSGMDVDATASTDPSKTGQISSSSSSTPVERVPMHEDNGTFYDQNGASMTVK